MMKKIISYIIVIFATLGIYSCSDILDAPGKSAFDEQTVFSQYPLAEFNIVSIYAIFGEQNGHRGRLLTWYGFNTDIEWYSNSGELGVGTPDNKQSIAVYTIVSNNSELNSERNPFSDMYAGIELCNIAIDGLRKYGNVDGNRDMKYLLGEALTLRAVFYHDLVKVWGDVPARFEPISNETIFIAKSSRDLIYKQLIADLQEAEAYLYWPNESRQTQKVDRMNRAYANGLLARICLMASGYAQRPDQVGTGSTGSVKMSDDPDLSREKLYPIALKACKDVIASGSAKLEGSFETIWRNSMKRDITAGGEPLFVVPFSDGRGRWLTQYAIKHDEANQYVSKGFGGSVGPVPTMFYEYESIDTRRDITCVNYKWAGKDAKQIPAGINTWYFGKFRYEWVPNSKSITDDDGIKPIYMRYADVLLMAAECENFINGHATAQQYLKEVRKRAYFGNEAAAEAYVNGITSKDAMFEALVNERGLEFCGEMLRKTDLIRWNKLTESMDQTKVKMTNLANHLPPFDDVNTNLYYKYAADGYTLITYGLEHGQNVPPPNLAEWTFEEYVTTGKLKQGKIDAIYWADPNKKQYWPLFDLLIKGNNQLVNDYGY